MRALAVDDDAKLLHFLARGLRESGHACETAPDAPRAAEILRSAAPFDVILLDVMMPGPSGFDFLGELRAAGERTPVIILSARHEVEERVRGLRLGADDYVVKPFALSELLARMEAVVRRREEQRLLRAGGLRLDLDLRTVELDGRAVAVTPSEFLLLKVLVEARGEPCSRAQLLRDVWELPFDPQTNVVEVRVARLRRKLGLGRPVIETVAGRGYRLASAPT